MLHTRLLSVMVVVAFIASLLAPFTLYAEAPKEQSATMAKMEVTPPMRGTVTIVEANGRFALNLGGDDALYNHAELLVIRNGTILGNAKVYHVGPLDAQAELLGKDKSVQLQTGDTVLVQFNPIPRSVRRHHPQSGSDMSLKCEKQFVALLTLIGVGYVVAINRHDAKRN